MLTIHGKIRAIQNQQYTNIVFEDLDRPYDDDYKYITVVLLPNWMYNKEHLQIGAEGFLQFEPVEAGKTLWFNKETQENEFYKYDNNYFINFIPEITDLKMTEFKI
jgi:hypothetical protein